MRNAQLLETAGNPLDPAININELKQINGRDFWSESTEETEQTESSFSVFSVPFCSKVTDNQFLKARC
jgi:hypothetical protein